jgi:hypothetical protein
MRKRESSKKGRFDRPSLMPASERESQHDSAPPSSSPPSRNSWMPPTGGIVKARLLPDVGWEQYDTSNIQIPLPAAPPLPFNPPPTQSMIPKAPLVPRVSMNPAMSPPPRTSLVPEPPPRGAAPGQAAPRKSIPPGAWGNAPNTQGRMSLSPDTQQRASLRPNDPWERMSLTPGVGFQSMAPGAIHGQNASEEDRRYTQALFLREQGRVGEAIAILDEICQVFPDHHEARNLQLKLALEHRDTPRIEAHAEWVVIYQAQRGQHQTVCSLYRSTRLAAQTMVWSEKALLAVLLASDKSGEGRVVVDVTKMLLHGYPQSYALPRALYASAAVQHNEGRPDLAKATLHNLVTRFPKDSLTPIARRRLGELG